MMLLLGKSQIFSFVCTTADRSSAEVQQTRPFLFRYAPIARSVTIWSLVIDSQIFFENLVWYLCHRSGNWSTARVILKVC